MKAQYYVGCSGGARDVFTAVTVPTEATHGARYAAVIGPFVTKRGATFMARFGQGNPHCRTVAEAERIARLYRRKTDLPRATFGQAVTS